MDEPRQATCPRCDDPLTGRSDRAYCSDACRQSAYRQRVTQAVAERAGLAALDWMMTLPTDGSTPEPAHSRNAEGLHSRNEGDDR